MAVVPPLRGEVVLNPDGTVTQKFAEYLEELEVAIGLSEEIDENFGTFLGLFAQNGDLDKRVAELEQLLPVHNLGDIMKRLEDLEQQQ